MARITALDLVLGMFRLALGVFALLWQSLSHERSGLMSTDVFGAIVALFCLYAMLIAGLAQQRPGMAEFVYAASAFIDLAFVTLLVRLSGGSASFFCATYVFLTAVHASYFGLAFGLIIGATSSVLCLLAVLWDAESPIDAVQLSFALALPLLAAFCVGVSRARRDESLTAGPPGASDGKPEVAKFGGRVLSLHVLSHLGASVPRQAALVDGLADAVLPAARVSAYAFLLADEAGTTYRLASRFGLDETIPGDWAPSSDWLERYGGCTAPMTHKASEGLGAELFEFTDTARGTWACVPVRDQGGTAGLLLAASDGPISSGTLDALVAAADQLAVDLRATRSP